MNTDARRRRSNRLVIALLLVAIAVTVASAINQVMFTAAQQSRNVCYQSAFDAFVVAVARIDEVAASERRAQREFLTAVAGDESELERRVAFERYLAVLTRADEIRQETDLVPEGGCG